MCARIWLITFCLLCSAEIWLEWLRDEVPLVCEPEEREKVEVLFNLAVKDYVCMYAYIFFSLMRRFRLKGIF